jgi:hypothetical protein
MISQTQPKDMRVDYDFLIEIHFDLYISVIYNAKNSKILKVKYLIGNIWNRKDIEISIK